MPKFNIGNLAEVSNTNYQDALSMGRLVRILDIYDIILGDDRIYYKVKVFGGFNEGNLLNDGTYSGYSLEESDLSPLGANEYQQKQKENFLQDYINDGVTLGNGNKYQYVNIDSVIDTTPSTLENNQANAQQLFNEYSKSIVSKIVNDTEVKELKDNKIYYVRTSKYGKILGVLEPKKDKKFVFIYVEGKLTLIPKEECIVVKLSDVYPTWLKVKINSCEQSSSLFPGNKKMRQELIGQKYRIFENIKQYKCKIDGQNRDIIIVEVPSKDPTVEPKKLKFLESEVEILYPNINGWKPKKNRTIIIDSTVKCINNKEFAKCNSVKVLKNEIFTVKKIETNQGCHQRSILHLRDSRGNIHKGYKAYFKVV